MSFEVHAYLGRHQQDLDRRVLNRLAAHGYKIELPPGRHLRSTSEDGSIWLAVCDTPPDFPRIERHSAFLVSFGYAFSARTADDLAFAPRGLRKFEHIVYSRTSAGTPTGARCLQHLMLAAMAAESSGHCLVDGDETALPGIAAFERAHGEIKAARNELDRNAPRFQGWPADGAPVDATDIIRAPEMPDFESPTPKKKWWQFW
ncbi:hypothetical protein LXM60_04715 [Pandoraea sputorum]|uniref:hypothetical protein n=1 Tax=Pandoraea sputorum TaxID=93222 RepID=UPI001E4AE2CD|nr:hypothetical protein [Pandoraea sputorum]MCE4059513.1 hypothetical protein [Pandoraea sputorum]